MKVFNLACEHDHRFEGWFGSASDFDTQLADGLLGCPMCASRDIRKMPAAPRLNLASTADRRRPEQSSEPVQPKQPTPQQLQAMMIQMARHLVEHTEDVGNRFADEARKIHYREAPERGIRGVATRDEAQELNDEGIEVFSFPLPSLAKEPLQ